MKSKLTMSDIKRVYAQTLGARGHQVSLKRLFDNCDQIHFHMEEIGRILSENNFSFVTNWGRYFRFKAVPVEPIYLQILRKFVARK